MSVQCEFHLAMVDQLGHAAMALFWSVPAWFLWDRAVSVAFAGTALLTSQLPDVDLYVPGLAHHGITHTVPFVLLASLLGAALVTALFERRVRRWWRVREGTDLSRTTLYAFVASALLVGGLSHLFVDLLSTPATGRPLQPFWPFFEKPFSVSPIERFSAPKWNIGPLIIALAVHLALYLSDLSSLRRRVRGFRE